ncbi:uncharacterized protein LOC127091248 [Lathyrus oleraceus]|uniref:uncharacterized protein LOC127091248 n=1 Tax=Pisum sativum TaxID=3888 RepID=UPI0021D0ABB9|nr:uncharacterized protein LOC127091248 [Pisum sativum]
MIEDASDGVMVEKIDDVKTPLAAFHARLMKAGLIDVCHDSCEECATYPRGCQMVRDNIQDLMKKGVLQISGVAKNEDVSVIEPCFNLPEPIEIPYYSTRMVPMNSHLSPVLILPSKESTVIAPAKEPKVVQPEDVVEFLKLIKRSDYKVVDQLHQPPSKISILSLLLNSQAHKEALLKVLAQAHVTQNITVDQFDGVVANITTCNTLSFSGKELPKDGQNHNRALHISVKCKDYALARVLVDTESSLNLKAFDGSRRIVIGEVELPILICPHIFPINFQVMDINPAYSCLLMHPWIHAAGAISSTLHQKMKFVVDNQLIIISGEDDFMVSHLSSFRYIEVDEDALETCFQTLEIANAIFVEMKDPIGKACSSFASLKSVKSSIEGGNPEGWAQPIDVREKHDRSVWDMCLPL